MIRDYDDFFGLMVSHLDVTSLLRNLFVSHLLKNLDQFAA